VINKRAILFWLGLFFATILTAWLYCIFTGQTAHARDLGQWDKADPELKAWYESLRQPDNPAVSCCGEADAYYADSYEMTAAGEYIAIITDERTVEGRVPRAAGTKIVIPKHKLKFDQGNPTGHGIVFLAPWSDPADPTVWCFLAPGGV
jgi:hypothetical protein